MHRALCPCTHTRRRTTATASCCHGASSSHHHLVMGTVELVHVRVRGLVRPRSAVTPRSRASAIAGDDGGTSTPGTPPARHCSATRTRTRTRA